MKECIKANKLSFKVGSFEWINFFGLPIGLFILGLMMLFFAIQPKVAIESTNFLLGFIVLTALGTGTYIVQYRKLKFRSFEIKGDLEGFKRNVREILTKNKWAIEYDNKSFIQAVQRGSILNLDLIALVFHERVIKWNVIHHPGSHNSIAALLSLNRYGKKIIKIIKASA